MNFIIKWFSAFRFFFQFEFHSFRDTEKCIRRIRKHRPNTSLESYLKKKKYIKLSHNEKTTGERNLKKKKID